MITDYKEYVKKIHSLKNELKQKKRKLDSSIKELRKVVIEELEREFSKYLRVENKDELLNKGYYYHNAIPDDAKSNVFLLDDDYGIIIRPDINSDMSMARISTVYKVKDKFIHPGTGFSAVFDPDEEISIEDFVKDCVEKLKKHNEIRKREKEKRILRRDIKRYNL